MINIPEAKEEWIIIKKNRHISNHNIVKNNTTKNTNVVNNTFGALQDFEEDGLSKVYGNANETGERDTTNTKSNQWKISPDYNMKSMSREMMEKVIEEYIIKEKDEDVTDTTDDDVTIVVSNSKVQSRDHEPSVECNNVTMEIISSMINEVLVEDKSELRAINRKCTEITTKLSLRYNNKLEYCNLMLGKRVMALDKINDECY